MNSLTKMMQNVEQKAVSWLLEGFIFEHEIKLNTELLKQVRQFVLGKLQEVADADGQYFDPNIGFKLGLIYVIVPFLTLMRGSKFQIIFRDMTDLNAFFEGLGVAGLLQQQPSCQDVLNEVKEHLADLKQIPFYQLALTLINFGVENLIA